MCIIKVLAWIKCLTKCPEKLFTKFIQLLLKYNSLPATKFFSEIIKQGATAGDDASFSGNNAGWDGAD